MELNEKYEPLSINIRIEAKIAKLEETGYTMIAFFSNIGGLVSFLYAFFRVCTL